MAVVTRKALVLCSKRGLMRCLPMNDAYECTVDTDGLFVACSKRSRIRNWPKHKHGPISFEPTYLTVLLVEQGGNIGLGILDVHFCGNFLKLGYCNVVSRDRIGLEVRIKFSVLTFCFGGFIPHGRTDFSSSRLFLGSFSFFSLYSTQYYLKYSLYNNIYIFQSSCI